MQAEIWIDGQKVFFVSAYIVLRENRREHIQAHLMHGSDDDIRLCYINDGGVEGEQSVGFKTLKQIAKGL